VVLAEKLLGKGYDLQIYDRSVRVATLMGSNRAYIDREIPHLERLMVGSPGVALAGAKIVIIGHVAPEDRPALMAGLAGHVVIDLAGYTDLRAQAGVTYEGLCW
jgi:GDP-mannose 6-dehydrogenase